ncbi:MAG: restriction endonuclease, SacI family [Anaerolineales bacterium]
MANINHQQAAAVLSQAFERAEQAFITSIEVQTKEDIDRNLDDIFDSGTQAYREVLLGCCVAKTVSPSIDVHLPYVKQGKDAFNGRDLDENVINPFLQGKQIPSSKGPYLSVFRRQVEFTPETRKGVRDKEGYDALVFVINELAKGKEDDRDKLLVALLFRFIKMREQANIPITKPHRVSLVQYKDLLNCLVSIQSGGWFPVLFAIGMFKTIKDYFNLDWEITWQSINVADSASGVGGDITIKSKNKILMSVEITLRQVDKARMISTFNTKIAPSGIEDYLFLVGANDPSKEAVEQAERYFAQGHEVNFAEIVNWIVMLLATFGKQGREIFGLHLVSLLESSETTQAAKVAWNDAINNLFIR